MKKHIEIELVNDPTIGLVTSFFHPKEINVQRTIKSCGNICKAERKSVFSNNVLKTNYLHIYVWNQRRNAYSHYIESKDGNIVFKNYEAPNF